MTNIGHHDVLQCSGLTNDRLQSWYARGLLDFLGNSKSGRGNSRTYEEKHLFVLRYMRIVADLGFSVVIAAGLGKDLMGRYDCLPQYSFWEDFSNGARHRMANEFRDYASASLMVDVGYIKYEIQQFLGDLIK